MISRVFLLLSAKLGTIHQTTNTRPTKNFMPNNTLYFYKNGKMLKYCFLTGGTGTRGWFILLICIGCPVEVNKTQQSEVGVKVSSQGKTK